MKGILVTGGAGFIGSHICLNLLKKGYKLFVIDSFINSSIQALNRVTFLYNKLGIDSNNDIKIYSGDVRDINILNKIFEDSISLNCRIIAVIHLAGLKSVPESIHNPIDYWDVNVNGTITLLKIMIKYDCFKFVFSSSATIYGNPKTVPILESFETKPINPYGKTKLAVENILGDLISYNKKFKIIILRYFNPIGAHYSGFLGENARLTVDNIFPNLLKVALKKIDYLKIFGNDWPTPDGTTIRDFIHVEDLAEGHIAAIKYIDQINQNILTLNLGTGKKTSILELISTFEIATNIKIPYKFFDKRRGDTSTLLASSKLSNKILNWKAERSLSEMCKDGWNYARNNSSNY